jgi:hypothetical protein
VRSSTQTKIPGGGPGGADTGSSRREEISMGWRRPSPIRPRPPKAPPAITTPNLGLNSLARRVNTPQKACNALLGLLCEPVLLRLIPRPKISLKFLRAGPNQWGGRLPGDDVPDTFRGVRIIKIDFLKKFPHWALTYRGIGVPITGFSPGVWQSGTEERGRARRRRVGREARAGDHGRPG